MSTETTAEIVTETESTFELIAAGKINAIELYSEGGIDPLTAKVREEVSNFKADVTTAKGRSAIASMGHKVARTKTAIDEMGKNITAEKKAECKKIDQARKSMRDEFDQIRDEVKKPLIEWKEAEAAKEQKILDDAAELEKRKTEENEAYAINERIDIDAKQKELEKREAAITAKENAEKEKLKQKERDEKTAAEAKELAEFNASEKIRIANDATEKIKKDAAAEVLRKENLVKEQQAETTRKHNAAIQKVKDDAAKAERTRIANEAEKARIIKADNDRIEKIRIAKAANVEHMRAINIKALNNLKEAMIDEEVAKRVIRLIAAGKISNVTINY